jgi:hypothetical protein
VTVSTGAGEESDGESAEESDESDE